MRFSSQVTCELTQTLQLLRCFLGVTPDNTVRQWYLRCKDLIEAYRPEMVYFDNASLPLGQPGLDIAAHYYNSSLAWPGLAWQGVAC